MSKLHELADLGQSVWMDYIRRAFITSGKLSALIDLGVRGMTSNPTIFEKAIVGSSAPGGGTSGEYDPDLARLAAEGKSASEIYEALAIDDIRMAADHLRPVYDTTKGDDGYVSLEVNPTLAHETDQTVDEALRLWSTVNRPNLMVKIPATKEGLPAITRATAAGVNVNITLIFSLVRYQQVMEAFLKGLEQRVAAGKPIDHIASVASFFVSRVDTKVDKRLESIMREEGQRADLAASLLGRAAVANAKLAYTLFREIFESQRFSALHAKGARVQRPLWASTSTKNPNYSDILYVQELIGPHTVNTMPQNTLENFLDHGEVRLTLEDGLDQAHGVMQKLESLGISMDQVTQELEDEGVEAFAKSFKELIESIDSLRKEILPGDQIPSFQLGQYEKRIDAALREMSAQNILDRIWRADFTVWKPDPAEITNRLGWLHIHEEMQRHLTEIEAVVDSIKRDGYTHALLLGMGGSSLAPDLFGKIFANSDKSNDSPLALEVLDSTVPGAVLAYAERLNPAKSVFIVSTKSGTTEETLSFFKYFYNWTVSALGEKGAGEHFIAITDPGSKLADLASRYGFRRTFLNDPNIGGRYSALSHFGLVPAALAGVDIRLLLERAARMAADCKSSDVKLNPAARLGATLGDLARAGRDKVTFFLSPQIVSFGDWVEQLIAESTGKEGRGILPVVDEPIGAPDSYSGDRLFVLIQLEDQPVDPEKIARLASAGHPIVRISLQDIYDLGGQFFLWELAIAIAGYRLGIQPFDQPNVESAKVLARQKVAAYKDSGQLPIPSPTLETQNLAIFGDVSGRSPVQALSSFLSRARPGDYVALQAFVQPAPATGAALSRMRLRLRQLTRLATTLGYGPRFLHSTGQLHKGDSGNGIFIQITADDLRDAPIPDQAGTSDSSISFGVLKMAQVLGDQQALIDAGRRVIRLHIKGDITREIDALAESL
jgi:transaldolase/glucose-6-phosphate isomerase